MPRTRRGATRSIRWRRRRGAWTGNDVRTFQQDAAEVRDGLRLGLRVLTEIREQGVPAWWLAGRAPPASGGVTMAPKTVACAAGTGEGRQALLRSVRHASGLSLAAVARAADTSATNVSAYERGVKRANDATLVRLTASVRAGSDSPIYRNRLVTVPAEAAAIRSGLRQGWSTADLLRVVRELRSNAKHLRNDTDLAAFYARPSTTGDRRWDALLAGVAEVDALRDGHEVPAWARGHDLPHLWFVGSSPSLHPHALAHTPSSLAVRGIVIDGAALESVLSLEGPLLDADQIRVRSPSSAGASTSAESRPGSSSSVERPWRSPTTPAERPLTSTACSNRR